MKDVLFLAASFYLLKQDVTRAVLENERSSGHAELHAGAQIRIDAGEVKSI